MRLKQRGDLRLRCKKGCHCPCFGQGTHQSAPFGDQLQAIGQAKDPGDTGGHIFTQAVTDHHIRLKAPGPPEAGQRIFQGKERRLGIGRLLEERRHRTLVPGWRIEDGQQGAAQQRLQQRITLVKHRPKGGLGGVELAAHIDCLATLPRKEKDQTWPAAGGYFAMDQTCLFGIGAKGSQFGDRFFGGSGREGQTMAIVVAPCIGRETEVDQ